jgi:hypothetical protein
MGYIMLELARAMRHDRTLQALEWASFAVLRARHDSAMEDVD